MTENTSWIKLHRQLTKWEWYTDSKMVHLFLHLLLNANYKESKWRGETIKRGQILTGRKQLASATGISEQSIRTCLKNLELTKELTSKSTNKYSIITIVNFEKYQQKDEKPTSKLTNDQPTTNQQLTTSKNTKEYKEELRRQFQHWAIESDLDTKKVDNQFEIAYLYYQNQGFKNKYGKSIDLQVSIRKWFKNLEDYKPDSLSINHTYPAN